MSACRPTAADSLEETKGTLDLRNRANFFISDFGFSTKSPFSLLFEVEQAETPEDEVNNRLTTLRDRLLAIDIEALEDGEKSVLFSEMATLLKTHSPDE